MKKAAIIFLLLSIGCVWGGWHAFTTQTTLIFSWVAPGLIIVGLIFHAWFWIYLGASMGYDVQGATDYQSAHIRREVNRAAGFSDASFIAGEMTRNNKK